MFLFQNVLPLRLPEVQTVCRNRTRQVLNQPQNQQITRPIQIQVFDMCQICHTFMHLFIPFGFISYLNELFLHLVCIPAVFTPCLYTLFLHLVCIPGSESSAAADSESSAASDSAGSTADKASSVRQSIRQMSRTARRTWLIPKFHAIWHLATSIRLFGR